VTTFIVVVDVTVEVVVETRSADADEGITARERAATIATASRR
jgi:hypothetical protein